MMAMLLAAGRGERMRPLTDHVPKPLLLAGGKPLIVWHIERLVRAGITDLVINHAHLGAQIESALGDGSRFGAHIRYSPEHPSALETAGGIAHALHLLGDQPFAAVNGDICCGYDFARLPAHAAALAASDDAAHLVLANNPPHHPNGDFLLNNGRLLPDDSRRQAAICPKLTFSGIGVYQPALFASIARGSSAPLAPLLRAQIALGKVSGEHYAGRWMDVGTPQRLEDLDKQLRATHNDSHG
ncbi:MAG: nucleotidyltransferase family protein [Nitrosomonadales bacterium]|nr:nucleotidyltransferase family protein [Nitrosomonadales bacterium]